MPTPASADAAPPTFDAMIAAHRGLILKVAASYTRSADERADLAQDIALQLWHAWPGYDRERPFGTWAYRVALNVAISHRRREHARGVHEPLADEHASLVGARDVDAEHDERLAIVQRAMQALTPLDRALLLLHLDGFALRDSGDVLGISEGNVATRLTRIRAQLRRLAGAETADASATSESASASNSATTSASTSARTSARTSATPASTPFATDGEHHGNR